MPSECADRCLRRSCGRPHGFTRHDDYPHGGDLRRNHLVRYPSQRVTQQIRRGTFACFRRFRWLAKVAQRLHLLLVEIRVVPC